MEHTAEERKLIHSMLVGAKKHLWDGKDVQNQEGTRFICHAIKNHVKSFAAGNPAIKVIEERLGRDNDGNRTVYEWLVDVAGVPVSEMTNLAVQTYRREWLDHLIEEFSK